MSTTKYKVGDKVWNIEGVEGEVKGFMEPAEGETKGAIQIKWADEDSLTTYTDDSQFSKNKPEQASQQAPVAKEEVAAEEEMVGDEMEGSFTEDGGYLAPTEQEEFAAATEDTEAAPIPVDEGNAIDAANNKNYRAEDGLLEGNGLYEYDVDTLKNLGIVERRTPDTQDSKLAKWFEWLDTNKIHLQEIIDRELGTILKKYPDTKIRFMVSNDPLTSQQVIQVIEYDSNIEKLHDDLLGGVITATTTENGKNVEKRWLVIGTTYSHIGIGAYNAIGNPIKQYLYKNKNVQAYVHPTIYSKVARMDAGRLVKRQAGEDTSQLRTLSELFADSSRNPAGLSFENAVFGIMYNGKHFVPNKAMPKNYFPPGKSDATLGRVFMMIPAANGNYIPIALKTKMFLNSEELRQGEFTNDIDALLRQLASKELAKRKAAIKALSKLIKFDSEGGKVLNGFLVGSKEVNNISIVQNGKSVRSWNLDDTNFSMVDFINTVKSFPFQINVQQWMLNDVDMLKSLDEAGILKTDVSTLRTANASYQIFAVDAAGKPVEVKVKEAIPNLQKINESKDGRSTTINGSTYRLINREYYDENSNVVEDKALRLSIHYNLYIQKYGLAPAYTNGKTGTSYYVIVSNEDNPTVIQRDKNGNVQVLNSESAKNAIKFFKEQAEIKERAENAEKEVKRINEGKEGIVGESFNGEEESAKPAEQQPAEAKPAGQKRVYIEPKHDDKTSFGPAISEITIWDKLNKEEVSIELHVRTVVDDSGNRVTDIAGWSENGFVYKIPWRDLYDKGVFLEVPAGYAEPKSNDAYAQELLGLDMITEKPDGTITATAWFKGNTKGSVYSTTVTLQKLNAQPKPVQQQAEETAAEVPVSNYDPNKATTKSLKDLEEERKTPTFEVMFFDREDEIYDIADSKGWDIGETSSSARAFIESKLKESYPDQKIDLDAINDVDNLIEMIKNCK